MDSEARFVSSACTLSDGALFPSVRIVVMAGEPLTVREVDYLADFSAWGLLVNQVGTATGQITPATRCR